MGSPGRSLLRKVLPGFIEARGIDFVIANGENAAGGSGMTGKVFSAITEPGVNVVTLGDHVWKRKEVVPVLNTNRRLLRPANLPDVCPGSGSVVLPSRSGIPVGVVTLLGRIFMDPSDCPFRTAEAEVEKLHRLARVVFVEIHAEASSEKIAMGWKLAGRVTCVFGTHTHVQTADERVIRGKTAYITDLGMTGPHESIIGRDIESVLFRFETGMFTPFKVAKGDVRLYGAVVGVDPETGSATSIERIVIQSEASFVR